MLFTVSVFAVKQADGLPEISDIALSNARSLWGDNLDTPEPIPYYDQDNELIAWCFNFSIGKAFPDKNALQQKCAEAFARGDRKEGSGNSEFGCMVLGAHQGMPVFIQYAQRLSEDYSRGKEIDEAAAREFPEGFTKGKTHYLDQANIWFSFTGDGRTVYINPLPYIKIISEDEFRVLGAKLGKFWEKRDHAQDWQNVPMSIGTQRTDVMLASVDYVPFYHWHWGCTPTAASMLISWWDQYKNYSLFDHYYMTHYDPHQEDFEHHVTDSCNDLHITLQTSDDGGTNTLNMSYGFQLFFQNRGYSWDFVYLDTIAPWYNLKQQIDAGRPLLTNTSSHSTAGVGYRENPDMYCTVDPNHAELTWVNLDELSTVLFFELDPLSSYPQVTLTNPIGQTNYYWEAIGGETFLSNDFYEITWDTQDAANTYVKLYYHLLGGADPNSWYTITTNTANDGSYVWTVPAVSHLGDDFSDYSRIKIEMYDSTTHELLASDGSYGNFTLGPAGNPILGNTNYTITEAKDFCQTSLNQPNAWYMISAKDNTADGSCGWSVDLYDYTSFENNLAHSFSSDENNYIVVNNYQVAADTYGVKFSNERNQTSAYANYSGSQTYILSTGTNNLTWDSSVYGKIWNVYLSPGNNFFEMTVDDSAADLDFALYQPGGDGIYTYDEAIAASRNNNPGQLESFSYNAVTAGYYGLAVTSRTQLNTDFQIKILPGIIWEGDVGVDWQLAGNWNTNSVPTASDNVFIPGGCPNNPMIFNSTTANAKTLTIENGTILTIATGTLMVNANLQTYGTIFLYNDSSLLRVMGNATWEDGSSIQNSVNSNIECYGNWTFQSGSVFMPGGGTVQMLSNRDTYITNHSLSTRFHNLTVNKQDSRTVYFLGSSTQDLLIVNSLTFQAGYMGSSSDRTIILQGQMLDTGGSYRFDHGKFKLTGGSGTIFGNANSWFHDLEIATPSTTQMASDILCKGSFFLPQASFNPNAHTLETYDDIVIDATLIMNNAASTLISGDDFQWGPNASCSATAGTMECFGNWVADSGSTVSLSNGVNVILSAYYGAQISINSSVFQFGNLTINGTEEDPRFYFDPEGVSSVTIVGDLTVNAANVFDIMDRQVLLLGTLNLFGILDVNSGQFTTNNAPSLNAGSVLDIGAGTFWNAKTTASIAYLNGTLIMDDPAGIFGGIYQSLNVPIGSVNNISAGTIRCGNITATNANTFQPIGGLVEFLTYPGTVSPNLNVSNGNWLHNAKINTDTSINLWTDLVINGNLELANGTLDVTSSNCNISIAGNWTHLQPEAVFVPMGGRVVFNGEEDQYLVGNETFNIVENANTGGAILLNNTAYTLSCAAYDTNVGYEMVQVTAGTFTANNMLDEGIFGNWAVQPQGVVNLSNSDGVVDLRGGINLSGGTINIYGGTSDSWWSEDSNTSITISSGQLNFHNRGIIIGDSSILYENITGGSIWTVGNFICNNPAFTPSGGQLIMSGSSTTTLSMISSSSLASLTIEKSEATSSVNATTDLKLMDSFYLLNGVFNAGGNIEVAGDWFNQVSPDNFHEGSYSVSFNGIGLQQIPWAETFFTMNVSNTADGVELGDASLGIRNALTVSGRLKLLPGSTVQVETNKAISVSTNGLLEAIGTAQDPILFTKLGTGNWNLSVTNGGTIAAEHATFEYTNPNTIRIFSTGVVDPDHAFNYCTFQHASTGATHLRLENSQDLTILGASFPVDNGGYNVYKPNDGGSATFIAATGILAGEDHDYDTYNRIHWVDAAPQITSISISYDSGNAILNWTSEPAHDNYKIYRSDTPYGGFIEIGTSTVTTWSEPASGIHNFYRVTSVTD